MGLFDRLRGGDTTRTPADPRPPAASAPPPRDWADIEAIRQEWPADGLDDVAGDLAAWTEGNRLYDSAEDYGSMVRSAALMCRALRHELYGTGILFGSDVPTTAHRVLFGSAFPPPDGRTLTDQAASQIRLGLTVVKKHSWQAREHGGDGAMAEPLLGWTMILTSAVAPSPQRPWEGNLKRFFTTRPIPLPRPAAPANGPAAGAGELDATLEQVQRTVDQAAAGDPAANARLLGSRAILSGDRETALRHFEEAAQLGDVDAMFDAGCVANELGQTSQAVSWWELAGGSRHAGSILNLGAHHESHGRIAEAQRWWQRAGEAGDAKGYAALTQVADNLGDDAAELHWSRLGAEAGQPFCQMRHAQLLMASHPQDRVVIPNQVVPLLVQAAEARQEHAPFLLGIAYGQLGDVTNARLWLQRAEAEGDADATRVMRENGLG